MIEKIRTICWTKRPLWYVIILSNRSISIHMFCSHMKIAFAAYCFLVMDTMIDCICSNSARVIVKKNVDKKFFHPLCSNIKHILLSAFYFLFAVVTIFVFTDKHKVNRSARSFKGTAKDFVWRGGTPL